MVSGASARERCVDIPEGCRQQQRALREGRAQSSTTVLRVSLVTWIILHGKVIDIYDLRSHFAHRRQSTQATGATPADGDIRLDGLPATLTGPRRPSNCSPETGSGRDNAGPSWASHASEVDRKRARPSFAIILHNFCCKLFDLYLN